MSLYKLLFFISILFTIVSCTQTKPEVTNPNTARNSSSNSEIRNDLNKEDVVENSLDDFEEFEEEFENSKPDISDPIMGYNRVMTSFNDKFYSYIFFPVVRGYRYATPEFVQGGIKNFFHNLLFPIRGVNNLLQLNLKSASKSYADVAF